MTDALVLVVSHNRVVAFFQKLWWKIYRFFQYRRCSECGNQSNKKYMNEVFFDWYCEDCCQAHRDEQARIDREVRIRNHMRDIQELEEAKLRFQAKNGVYRG